jgi:hypothetical protein
MNEEFEGNSLIGKTSTISASRSLNLGSSFSLEVL